MYSRIFFSNFEILTTVYQKHYAKGFHQANFGQSRPLRAEFSHILVCAKFYFIFCGYPIFSQKLNIFRKMIIYLEKSNFLTRKLDFLVANSSKEKIYRRKNILSSLSTRTNLNFRFMKTTS
jgi:hypothetical protein